MPITKNDYSQTIMYKIVCKDLNIKSCYVGHTTNFRIRKNSHKSSCCNQNNKKYNLFVYTTIREKGGWDNFQMIEIEKFDCKDGNEAKARERYWIEELKSDLNSSIPTRTYNEYYQDNKEQILEQHKNYRETNKEQILEQQKEYRETNKEILLEQKKEYYQDNKEQILEHRKEYYQSNKEKAKEYYQDNKEQILEQRKEYYQDNKEKIAELKKEYNKKYCEKNKEKIAEQKKIL
jgi:hypothetical protein